ncbi:MAG: non-canonical purine NTP pyrophosphatase, partial [Bdellovibrionia bacterium]
GTNGFGYDSVFIPNGSTKTLAEMTDSEKNAISHRLKALQELMVLVKSHGIVFAKP